MLRDVRWQVLLALAWFALALPMGAAGSSGKIIYTFQGGVDGADPESDVILDAAGNLYGTTYQGGTGCNGYGCGTVFELIPTKDGWKHQVLYSFTGYPNDGALPQAGLIFDSTGNLYGTTTGGGSQNCDCGTVFKLTPDSHGGWSESVLYSFGGYNGDGQVPNTDLVFDSQGNLYGTTSGVLAAGGCGTVYTLVPNPEGTWTESTIYSFCGNRADARVPITPVLLDGDGNIFGATQLGGGGECLFDGCGAIYELAPKPGGGWAETVLYSFFKGQGSAKFPSGGFVLDNLGRVLGTTSVGGDGYGTFFQLERTKKGWEQTVLHRFYGDPDGRYPVGRLAVGPQGHLFGATSFGGANGVLGGAVFELEPADHGWRERVLFSGTNTAYGPKAGPTIDSQGRVYGTLAGGTGNNKSFGAVYEIVP